MADAPDRRGAAGPAAEPPGPTPATPARRRLGLALIAVGAAALLWAVLYMNVHALGTYSAGRSFADRRPYDTVKRSAHEAFPGFLLRAALGGALVWGGLRLRRGARGQA